MRKGRSNTHLWKSRSCHVSSEPRNFTWKVWSIRYRCWQIISSSKRREKCHFPNTTLSSRTTNFLIIARKKNYPVNITKELNQTFSELFEKWMRKYLRENKKIWILINTFTESLNFKKIYSVYQRHSKLSWMETRSNSSQDLYWIDRKVGKASTYALIPFL